MCLPLNCCSCTFILCRSLCTSMVFRLKRCCPVYEPADSSQAACCLSTGRITTAHNSVAGTIPEATEGVLCLKSEGSWSQGHLNHNTLKLSYPVYTNSCCDYVAVIATMQRQCRLTCVCANRALLQEHYCRICRLLSKLWRCADGLPWKARGSVRAWWFCRFCFEVGYCIFDSCLAPPAFEISHL